MITKQFNQPEYWQSRISGELDLGVVGYRSLGKGYNQIIYQRRLEALNEIVSASSKPFNELKILEIGCGSGFYVEYWQSLGVRSLTGVDISPGSIELMKKLYPNYSFFVVDGTNSNALASLNGQFDIITIFDVIYHVIDDNKATKLLLNCASVLNNTGNILVTDCPGDTNYGFVKHVRYRSTSFYVESLNSVEHVILDRMHLFNLLHPPLARNKALDYVISGLYYLAGKLWRLHDAIGRMFGRMFYDIDSVLFAFGIRLPNQVMMLIGRNNVCSILHKDSKEANSSE